MTREDIVDTKTASTILGLKSEQFIRKMIQEGSLEPINPSQRWQEGSFFFFKEEVLNLRESHKDDYQYFSLKEQGYVNITKAAKKLGMSRWNIEKCIERLKIKPLEINRGKINRYMLSPADVKMIDQNRDFKVHTETREFHLLSKVKYNDSIYRIKEIKQTIEGYRLKLLNSNFEATTVLSEEVELLSNPIKKKSSHIEGNRLKSIDIRFNLSVLFYEDGDHFVDMLFDNVWTKGFRINGSESGKYEISVKDGVILSDLTKNEISIVERILKNYSDNGQALVDGSEVLLSSTDMVFGNIVLNKYQGDSLKKIANIEGKPIHKIMTDWITEKINEVREEYGGNDS